MVPSGANDLDGDARDRVRTVDEQGGPALSPRSADDLESRFCNTAGVGRETYCPFALATAAGRARTIARFVAEPDAGVLALLMEFTSTALNPTQGLIKGDRLLDLVRATAGTEEVLTRFAQRLAAEPWALYDVRRALSPRRDGKVSHSRRLHALVHGDEVTVREALGQRACAEGQEVTVGCPEYPTDEHPRVWLRRRDEQAPTAERFLAIAPATAADKTGPAFPAAWAAADQLAMRF